MQSPTLRDMIQDALARGATYRKLEALAIDPVSGKKASYALFNNIVLGNRKEDTMPSQEHLRAIAAALQVPYERVRQAAIAQWVPADGESSIPPAPVGIDAAEWASYDDIGRQAVLDALHIADRRRLRNPPDEGARTRTG